MQEKQMIVFLALDKCLLMQEKIYKEQSSAHGFIPYRAITFSSNDNTQKVVK